VPSASQLVNQPLVGSFNGPEGEERIAPKPLGRITAKDLQKSLEHGLDVDEKKIKKKSKSKSSLSGSKNLGSAMSLINNPLKNSTGGLSGDSNTHGGISQLGITAKDLHKSFENGLQNSLEGEKKKSKSKSNLSKSKGSISNLLSKELEGPFGAPLKPERMSDIPLNVNAATLINGTNTFYTATDADKQRNAEKEASAATNSEKKPLMTQLN
jgi:hypothetical protein